MRFRNGYFKDTLASRSFAGTIGAVVQWPTRPRTHLIIFLKLCFVLLCVSPLQSFKLKSEAEEYEKII